MFGSAVIVFRETLEAALIVGILLAAVGSLPRVRRWIAAGIFAGLAGATVVATFAEVIAASLEGAGQEYFNALVLLVAVVMLAWHNVWMKSHGRELSRELRAAGERVTAGTSSLSALLVVVALAVMREGSEVALFLYGLAIGGAENSAIFIGGIAGLALGIALGAMIYTGLARIPQRHLFSVTGWLLTLLAAGMASQAAGFLTQAGALPPLADPLWDTSAFISERHPLGQMLHVLIGYNEKPSGVQMLFFVVTIIAIVTLTVRSERRILRPRVATASVVSTLSLVALFAAGLLRSDATHAAHVVYSPIVEEGEYAVELRGHVNKDSDAVVNQAQQYKLEIEHAPTSRWLTSLVGEVEKEPGESLKTTAIEWENIFQLTEQGAHWLDVGVLAAVSRELEKDVHDKLELGVLLEKSTGRFATTLNLLAEHEMGGESETEVEYAARWRWRKSQRFEPTIEIYGHLGDVDHLQSFSDQQHSIGPGLLGMVALTGRSKLRYEAAYLVGVSAAAPNATVRFRIEYEF